jgi:AraC-like DNA-binding protein
MFVARGRTSHLNAELATTVAFGGGLTFVHINRRGVVYDTRFIPAAASTTNDASLYVVLEGRWRTFGAPDERDFTGPAAFAIATSQFEGENGAYPFRWIAGGHPYRGLELRLSADELRVPLGASPTPIDLSEDDVRAAEAVARASGDDASFERESAAFVRRLAERGLLDPSVAETFPQSSPVFARLWKALRPMIERHYLSPTLQEVSNESGISLRQLDRVIESFVEATPLLRGHGWRAATRRFRLKVAVMLLSAEGATVTEVARLVGYGSGEAMGRSFRDAGLGSPSAVQAALRRGEWEKE